MNIFIMPKSQIENKHWIKHSFKNFTKMYQETRNYYVTYVAYVVFHAVFYEVQITYCQETIIFEFRIIDVSKNYL